MSNTVILTGRIDGVVAMRDSPDGNHRIATFALRVFRRPTAIARPSAKDAADVLPIVAFDKLADSVERSGQHGRLVQVVGKLRRDTWRTDEGFERSRLQVVADAVIYLERRLEQAASVAPADDDIPF